MSEDHTSIWDINNWLIDREGWKPICAIAYVSICIFDFIVVPAWWGMTRPPVELVIQNLPDADIVVQLEYLKVLTEHHNPFTLHMGGMFHIAFGALLTGSAITRK